MPSSITWGQFILFLLVATCVYYGYVVLKYYRAELAALLRGQRGAGHVGQAAAGGAASGFATGAAASGAVAGATAGTSASGVTSGVATTKQGSMFPASPAGGSEEAELFKVMEKVVDRLKALISDALTSGIGREDLLDHIRELLGAYRQLRRTPYQEAVNNFLERSCATNFSLALSAEDLAGLWGK